ncbi:MAG: hypothetical protein IPL33_12810 [Sphingobacteriales bacterium]|nr:hypothetical protein [Sphingobacteriales bacterium]
MKAAFEEHTNKVDKMIQLNGLIKNKVRDKKTKTQKNTKIRLLKVCPSGELVPLKEGNLVPASKRDLVPLKREFSAPQRGENLYGYNLLIINNLR